jgi:hypothetical protein
MYVCILSCCFLIVLSLDYVIVSCYQHMAQFLHVYYQLLICMS